MQLADPDLRQPLQIVALLRGRVDDIDRRLGDKLDGMDERLKRRMDALDGRLIALIDAFHSGRVWALAFYIAMAGAMLGTVARGFGWP